MMKFTRLLLLPLLVTCLFCACSNDDDEENGGGTSVKMRNDNANDSKVNAAYSRLEFPKVKGGNTIVLIHSTSKYGINYSVEWDCGKKAQRWSCYQMYASNSVANTTRYYADASKGEVQYPYDPSLSSEFYFTSDPYWNTIYEHGHICPSADRKCSREANIQTFYLTNMQPQVKGFNAGVWFNMEGRVRKWNNSNFRDTLFVCKGGTIEPTASRPDAVLRTLGSGLIVPKYYYMALLCKKYNSDKKDYDYKALGFWVEHKSNNDNQLKSYVVNIDYIEKMTGIDFFCNLPDELENKLEAVDKELVSISWGLK